MQSKYTYASKISALLKLSLSLSFAHYLCVSQFMTIAQSISICQTMIMAIFVLLLSSACRLQNVVIITAITRTFITCTQTHTPHTSIFRSSFVGRSSILRWWQWDSKSCLSSAQFQFAAQQIEISFIVSPTNARNINNNVRQYLV